MFTSEDTATIGPGEEHPKPSWENEFDQREQTHIGYARHYAQFYSHGAPGHLDLVVIAKLADLLDKQNGIVRP